MFDGDGKRISPDKASSGLQIVDMHGEGKAVCTLLEQKNNQQESTPVKNAPRKRKLGSTVIKREAVSVERIVIEKPDSKSAAKVQVSVRQLQNSIRKVAIKQL